MESSKSIYFLSEEGEEIEMVILEQTTVAGCNYLLVEEAPGEESSEDTMAYIMKADPQASADEMSVYEFVEDESELEFVSKIFEQLIDDMDIIME